uniref:Avidin n=1 Tax=Nothoprocta perdicaria TaxID=30464 RepID=A0A8C7EDU7_NOTPE
AADTMQVAAVLVALALALAVPSSSAERKVTGLWKNQLGSNMTLSALDAEGTFTGSYHTAVADTNKRILVSPLRGAQQPGTKGQATFGFTVQWQFTDSVTAFVGQCFVDHRGKETLETTWLLREEVPTRRDSWKATRIGTNTFTRVKG